MLLNLYKIKSKNKYNVILNINKKQISMNQHNLQIIKIILTSKKVFFLQNKLFYHPKIRKSNKKEFLAVQFEHEYIFLFTL